MDTYCFVLCRSNIYIDLRKKVKKDYDTLSWAVDMVRNMIGQMPKLILFARSVTEVKELYIYFWTKLEHFKEGIKANRYCPFSDSYLLYYIVKLPCNNNS